MPNGFQIFNIFCLKTVLFRTHQPWCFSLYMHGSAIVSKKPRGEEGGGGGGGRPPFYFLASGACMSRRMEPFSTQVPDIDTGHPSFRY
jgi:hypothetical protein